MTGKGGDCMKKKDIRQISQVMIAGAAIAVVLAAVGYTGVDIWLASTQWLLVAAVLALFGIYARMSS